MISAVEALALVELTPDEEREAQRLEAALDAAIHDKFEGGPFVVRFDERIPLRVAHNRRRKYEEGDGRLGAAVWRVAVDQRQVEEKWSTTFSFTPVFFAQSVRSLAAKKELKLPALASVSSIAQAPPGKRLLVRMPTRSRPAQALSVLQKYRDKAGAPVQIEVVVDEDDESMLAGDVLQRLVALGCVVTVGRHRSKVEACNGGRLTDWDVLMLASDDMVPVADGYAKKILAAMEEHFPYLDGAVHFNDGFRGEELCTLPILGRRLWEQFGYVYDSAYESLFCDTEQTAVLRALGRLAYVDELLIEHQRVAVGAPKKDALYDRNDAFWDRDKGVYELRQKSFRPGARIAFNSPPLRLSILIATLPERRAQLDRLLEHLWSQILWSVLRDCRAAAMREVEVLVDAREPPVTVGEKRQSLLERARGDYVAFIDDDDWVSHDYVDRVVCALTTNSGVDCLSLTGVMTTDGAQPEVFEHSVRYGVWYSENGRHYRSPNHLNAVKREIALKVGFEAKNVGEDYDYSKRLRAYLKTEAPLYSKKPLKTEVPLGERPVYYYFFKPRQSVQSATAG